MLNRFNILNMIGVILGILLVTAIGLPLLDARLLEPSYKNGKAGAADTNRIPIQEPKTNTSLCPRRLHKCPANEDVRKLCFDCDDGLEYMCNDNIIYNFAMEFCANKLQQVEKGRRLVCIYIQQYNSVYLREEPCPPGTYKPRRALMNVSCADHDPPPPHFIIRTPGTTTAPPRGYCDWKQGYFNPDHHNFLYTNETYLTTCVHRSEPSNLCAQILDILPNGTCSPPCVSGERDVSHQFVCINGTITDSSTASFVISPVPNYKTKKPSTTTAVPVVTTNQINPEVKNTNPMAMYATVAVALVFGCATIFVVGAAVILYHRRQVKDGQSKSNFIRGDYVNILGCYSVSYNKNNGAAIELNSTPLITRRNPRTSEHDDNQHMEQHKDIDESAGQQADIMTDVHDTDETEIKKPFTTDQES